MNNYSKDQAREIVAGQLGALTKSEYAEKSAGAYLNLKKLFYSHYGQNFERVLLYTAIKKWREVDTKSLITDFPKLHFDLLGATSDTTFPSGLFDCIIVPLYGFTPNGYRLGHGKGWYDSFLVLQPEAFLIGLGLDAGLVDFVVDSYDVPMDAIVTESKHEILRKRS